MNHSILYVDKVLFTPDEKILISKSSSEIKFWDAKTRKIIRTIEGDFNFLHDIAISGDGKVLGGGCENIKLWDIETGKLINVINGNFDWINNICFIPDGEHIAVVSIRMNDFNDSDDEFIIYGSNNEVFDFVRLELWNINNKRLVWAKILLSEPSFLECTEDGWLVYNENNVISFLNFRNPEEIRNLKGHSDLIYDIAFSPDGKLCASGGKDKIINIWDIKKFELKCTIDTKNKEVFSLIFTQNEKNLVVGNEGEIIVWNLKDKKIIARLRSTFSKTIKNVKPPHILSLAYSFRDKILVSAVGSSTGIQFWSLTNFQLIETFGLYYDYIDSIAFSYDSKYLALKTNKNIIVWDLQKNKEKKQIDLTINIRSITFTSDGKILGIRHESGKCDIYTLYPKKELRTFVFPNNLYSMVIDYNNDILIAGSQGEIVFFDLKREIQTKFMTSDFIVDYLAISPDGKLLSFISSKSIIKVMNIKERKIIKKFGNPDETVYATFFSPDNKFIAFFGDDNLIKLLDIVSGEVIAILNERDFREIVNLAFSPDGQLLASAGNNSITLWNINEKKVAKKFYSHDNHVYFISFSPDGKYLVSLSKDRTAKLWDVKTGKLISTFIGFFDALIIISPNGDVAGGRNFKNYVYFMDINNNIYDFDGMLI